MSDLISREAFSSHIKNVLGLGDEENGSDPEYMEGLNDCNEALMTFPSTDIMECARAIKDYCDKTRCEKCELAEHKVMNDTDNYLCRVHYLRPECWDLPEGEKE